MDAGAKFEDNPLSHSRWADKNQTHKLSEGRKKPESTLAVVLNFSLHRIVKTLRGQTNVIVQLVPRTKTFWRLFGPLPSPTSII